MALEDVNVVFAHGAWADGSSWGPVITALDAEGTRVSAAPLPLTSLADDVAALNRSHNLPVETGYPSDAVTFEWARETFPDMLAYFDSILGNS